MSDKVSRMLLGLFLCSATMQALQRGHRVRQQASCARQSNEALRHQVSPDSAIPSSLQLQQGPPQNGAILKMGRVADSATASVAFLSANRVTDCAHSALTSAAGLRRATRHFGHSVCDDSSLSDGMPCTIHVSPPSLSVIHASRSAQSLPGELTVELHCDTQQAHKTYGHSITGSASFSSTAILSSAGSATTHKQHRQINASNPTDVPPQQDRVHDFVHLSLNGHHSTTTRPADILDTHRHQ